MKQAVYSPEGDVVAFVEIKVSFWDSVIGGAAQALDNVKKAPARRKALNAYADHLLRDEYAAEAQARTQKQAEKAAAKAARQTSKLDEVVNSTTVA